MKLAIMQPYFLPYVGYFQLINAVDKFILYDNLPYIKHGWINRNYIVQKNGSLSSITVPLQHKSSNTLISEIKIYQGQNWQRKILKDIYHCYKGATAFDEFYSLLETLFTGRIYISLHELNENLIFMVADFLGIPTKIITDNKNYLPDGPIECPPETKVQRIIEICRANNVEMYVNAIGGQKIYNKEEFLSYGVNLRFLRTNEIAYKQFKDAFIPNLSIVDVIMHNGKGKTRKLLDEYTLV